MFKTRTLRTLGLAALIAFTIVTKVTIAPAAEREVLAPRYERMVKDQEEYDRAHNALTKATVLQELQDDMLKQPIESLLPLLSHRQWEIRKSAAYTLRQKPPAEVNRDNVRRVIVERVKQETEEWVVPDLIYAVVVTKATATIPDLTHWLFDSKHSDTRRHLAHSLGELGSPIAVPALIKAANDQVEDVSIASLWALAKIGDKAALPVLRKFALGDQMPHKLVALQGLGLMQDTADIPFLQSLLKSTDERFVEQAAWGLGQTKATVAIPDLMLLLDARSPKVREAAYRALLNIGGQGVLRAFLARYAAKPDDERALSGIRDLYHWVSLPEARRTLAEGDIEALALALTAATPADNRERTSNPNGKVDQHEIMRIRALDDWYFVTTNYGPPGILSGGGDVFVVRRVQGKWLMARIIGSWIS